MLDVGVRDDALGLLSSMHEAGEERSVQPATVRYMQTRGADDVEMGVLDLPAGPSGVVGLRASGRTGHRLHGRSRGARCGFASPR